MLEASLTTVNLNVVAYSRLGLCNPLGEAALDAALDLTDLAPGDRAADLGCGNGVVALRLAERGLAVEAVERNPAMAEVAAARIAAAEAAGRPRVALHVEDAAAFLGRSPPFRLVVALGSSGIADFPALAARLEPGGWLLWGDICWRAEPGAPLRQVIEAYGDYLPHEGWVEAGRAAGLTPVHQALSGPEDWAGYVAGFGAAVDEWIAANPGRTAGPGLRLRAEAMARLFSGETLETVGFGLYLFRRPAA